MTTGHPAATLIAQDFGHLQHTNGKGETGVIHMPGFLTTGMAAEQIAQQNGPLALALAQALIETLEARYGYLVIHRDELDTKAQAIAAQIVNKTKTIELPPCVQCGQQVFNLDATKNNINIGVIATIAQAHLDTCK